MTCQNFLGSNVYNHVFSLYFVVSQVPNGDENNCHRDDSYINQEQRKQDIMNIEPNYYAHGDCETSSVNIHKEQSLKKPKLGVIQKVTVALTRIFKSKL